MAGVSIIARPVISQAFDQSKLHNDAGPSLCYASLSFRILGLFPTFIDRGKALHWSHGGFGRRPQRFHYTEYLQL